jgi:hypothetical protein
MISSSLSPADFRREALLRLAGGAGGPSPPVTTEGGAMTIDLGGLLGGPGGPPDTSSRNLLGEHERAHRGCVGFHHDGDHVVAAFRRADG